MKKKEPRPGCAGVVLGCAVVCFGVAVLVTAMFESADAGVYVGLVAGSVYVSWVMLGFITGRYEEA